MKLINKRLLGLLLALIMVSMTPLTALAAEATKETTVTESTTVSDKALANYTYIVNDNEQTVTLTKYIGTETAVVVEDNYIIDNRTYATVLDSSSVFRYNSTITSVTIGSGVAFKDNSMAYLFSGCKKLTSVDMTGVDTSEITDMSYLFDWCNKLTTITGYENWDTSKVKSIYKAFNRNNSITIVDLSKWDLSSVINSGWCFQQCYATEIKLPDNLKTISAGFLNHASKVTGSTFTIPAGVEKIGYAHTIYDFATDDFVEFNVAEGNLNYIAIDGILYSADGTEMLAIPRNKTFENGIYEVPEGVTFLGELSFSRNYNITTLVLPDSYVIEYVPLNDSRYIVYEDIGNINAGTNLSIAIYCYTGITQYAVKDSNPNYTSLNGIIYSKDMTEVVAIPARYAKEIVIPEGITTWNKEAMWADTDNNSSSTLIKLMANCPGVNIPTTLTKISDDQLAMLNLLYNSRKDTTNPFTITIAEGNTSFALDDNGNLVSVHVHDYESTITEPTCTEQGYTTYSCDCGDYYLNDYVDPNGHDYKNGICNICESSVLDADFTHAIPENQGVQNAIDRAYTLTDVEWTPIKDVPGVQKINGEYTVITFEAGKTYKGIPYSGVTANDCYVGLNVSLESYLSALENENSVLYTENLHSTNKKSATYYATVCSKFAQYILNVPGSYNTNNVANIPGMETIALPGAYTVDQIKLGDVILNTSTHTSVCTDILYDSDGNVAFIEISEAVMPLVRRQYWNVEEFYEHFATYRLCRYAYIDEVPAATNIDLDDSYALMPRFGDKYNYKVSSSKGIVDVLESGYTKAVILRDGIVIDEITLNGATSFTFDKSIPGYLEMYLEKADGTKSNSVYACVVKSSVIVEDATQFVNGKLTVTIDGSHGTPLYVQVGSAHAIFCNVEREDKTVELTFPASKISTQQVRVAYQNEYGIYLSNWVSFTAKENPSEDALLSQAQYWNGYNITPSSPTPVIQSNKVGYWSYTMIPVEENTTYYSVGSTRMWFLDSNGNPISTYNAYKDGSVPFQFTTPADTAYVNIAYSPNLVTQGTETLVHVHNYENGTCIECGHWNGPVITKQPESILVSIGKKFSVTVDAEGEGLTYQWYYKNKGSNQFSPSTFKSKSYTMTMAEFVNGRQIYCVITDVNGNSVTTETVSITAPLTITKQPTSVQVKIGQPATITIAAIGDDLTYQWYYKNNGDSTFKPSSYKGKIYSVTMADFCHNRQVYCVITDKYGTTVTSEIATMSRPPLELNIIKQPQNVQTKIGENFSVSIQAEGEGLSYQWYYSNNGGKSFSPSSFKGNTYSMTMREYCHNRQVYCVVTDMYGNQVTSEIATITRPALIELMILTQPTDVYSSVGKRFAVTFTVQGEGLSYQWYFKDPDMKTFKLSSNRSSSYSYKLCDYHDKRQIYCKITDMYGNSVSTEFVTLHVKQ